MVARRRVVTGIGPDGQSMVISNGPTPGRFDSDEWEELWVFDGVPANLSDPTDPAALQTFRLVPPAGQVACRIFTVAANGTPQSPDAEREWRQRIDYTDTERLPPPADPRMHRTPTIDIIVVITGEMDLVLDGGDGVHLRPGDSVIQRGTMHAWHNGSSEPCVAVSFMVSAE